MKNETLGEVIRQARVSRSIGLRDCAKTLEITPSYLSDIEYDRRVPAEDVLRKIATLLHLNFDELMALAGRFGDRTERYLRRQPIAGKLLREASSQNLSAEDLQRLLQEARRLGEKKGKGEVS